jgi:predicted kinase
MAGLPGAGKSTLSLAVGRVLGWPVVDKDLFDAVARTAGVTQVSPTALAYDLAFALVEDLLVEQRLSVILDCPAVMTDPVERGAQLAQQAGARFQVILCLASQAVRNERMGRLVPPSSRAWRHPARRRPSDVGTDGREHFGHLPAGTLQVDTTRPPDEMIKEVREHLGH